MSRRVTVRRWIPVLLAAAVSMVGCTTIGCTKMITGSASGDDVVTTTGGRSTSSDRTATSVSRTAVSTSEQATTGCALLTFKDLPYRTVNTAVDPSETGFDPNYAQSCRWAAVDGGREIGVSLRFRETGPVVLKTSTGTYAVAGRSVAYHQQTADSGKQVACVLAMGFVGGGVAISVVDDTNNYGLPCEQGRHVAELLLSREPR